LYVTSIAQSRRLYFVRNCSIAPRRKYFSASAGDKYGATLAGRGTWLAGGAYPVAASEGKLATAMGVNSLNRKFLLSHHFGDGRGDKGTGSFDFVSCADPLASAQAEDFNSAQRTGSSNGSTLTLSANLFRAVL
jgi:hypothetical protein